MFYPKKRARHANNLNQKENVHVSRTILTKTRHRLRLRVRVSFPYTFPGVLL